MPVLSKTLNPLLRQQATAHSASSGQASLGRRPVRQAVQALSEAERAQGYGPQAGQTGLGRRQAYGPQAPATLGSISAV